MVCLALLAGGTLVSCTRPTDGPPTTKPRSDIILPRDTEVLEGKVRAQSTLPLLLREAKLRDDLVPAMVELTSRVFDWRKLKANHSFKLERTLSGLLRLFEYEIDNDRFLRVTGTTDNQPEDLHAELVPYKKDRSAVTVQGEINRDTTSLFAAMEAAGERPDLSLDLAGIFAGEIDFNTELQPGDHFKVAVEKVYREGQFCEYGPIDAAEFTNNGRTFHAVRFTLPGEKAGYYDEQGRSLRRFFLKSPLPLQAPISSHFSNARLHPILRIVRPHLGVDYAAPAGTMVVAVSSGSVVSAGWSGEGGNMVHLRHSSGYETFYMHLSSIGKGVRAGAHVSQGDLIGRVGMTGMATGPHLDYRVKRDGRFVNPETLHRSLPPGEPIPTTLMAAFQAQRDLALARLAGGGALVAAQPSPAPVPPAPTPTK